MANVIPMAGLGSRFADVGYALPKPLIPVGGKPMIVRVIESLPESNKWIFLVREEHIAEYAIDSLIKTKIHDAIIVPVVGITEGQASTCALALPYLEPDEPLFIAACDNSFLFNREKFESLKKDPSIDAVVWTFTKHASLHEKPESWGWVKLGKDGLTIDDVSVKVPISDDPFNGHAVVGAFYFRRAADFKEAYELMVKANHRTKGEFYVDSLPKFYKQLHRKSVIFDVDLYVGWGKPEDLSLYEEWEQKVKTDSFPEDPEFATWKKFILSLP
jgi:NDP-sugar pyrophosphorylase family protein